MAKIWEKVISILAGNLKSGLSYLITTVLKGDCSSIRYLVKPNYSCKFFFVRFSVQCVFINKK